MSALRWDVIGSEVSALSIMHDDGDPFVYSFKKCNSGWENMTTEELIHGPCEAIFPTLQGAKEWAQRTEDYWSRTTPVTNTPPERGEGGSDG